ncbi:MAG: hypothetical protein QM723_23625 [Myxococcaceae bacterium]
MSTENWNRYRALKAAALKAALRNSGGHDPLSARKAVRTNLVQLLGLFALMGAKGNRAAQRLVPNLDARVSSKHGGGDLPGWLALEQSIKAAGRSSLSMKRLARMARALAN